MESGSQEDGDFPGVVNSVEGDHRSKGMSTGTQGGGVLTIREMKQETENSIRQVESNAETRGLRLLQILGLRRHDAGLDLTLTERLISDVLTAQRVSFVNAAFDDVNWQGMVDGLVSLIKSFLHELSRAIWQTEERETEVSRAIRQTVSLGRPGRRNRVLGAREYEKRG